MFKRLTCLLVLLSSALAVPAQDLLDYPPLLGGPKVRLDAAMAPVVTTLTADGDFLTVHADGVVSLVSLSVDGEMATSFYAGGGTDTPQGPIGTEPVPTLRTKWCDEKGVEHEVVTPIVSTTDGGVKKAVALHNQLVGIMQAQHPPKPCPPPPPPPPPGGP